MANEPTLPAKRYAKLVNDLGTERAFQRGWMTRVGDLLGVHNSYISLLHSGQRLDVGGSVIARAIEKMSLDPAYFFDATLSEPSYRDFQVGAKHVFPAVGKPYRQIGAHRSSESQSMWPVRLAIEAAADDSTIDQAEAFAALMLPTVRVLADSIQIVLNQDISKPRRLEESRELAQRILEQERRANLGGQSGESEE